jgi:hypothetical protein
VTFTRTGPDGLFEYSADLPTQYYDPRGADAGVDDPANTTGFQDATYPRGTGDPLSFERCAEGGIPVSCDKQERFEKRFLELEAQIERDAERNKRPPSGSSHGSSTTGQHEMIHTERNSFGARQTNATSKPEDDLALGGGVAPASLPVDSGDGCEYGTNGGPNNCFVQSWPWEDVDASVGQRTAPGDARREAITLAVYKNALWRLRKKPDCAKYIQGNNSENPADALEKMFAGGLNKNKILYGGAGTTSRGGKIEKGAIADTDPAGLGKGSGATIFLDDPFFDKSGSVGNWHGTLSTHNARTMVLLHELRHAMSGIGHPVFLKPDGTQDLEKMSNDPESNESFMRNIAQKCFGVTL